MKALMLASVASMIDQFNKKNIELLQNMGYEVEVACNFELGNTSSKERVKAFQKELAAQNVPYIQVPIPRKLSALGDILTSYRMIKQLVEQEHYDLVHCHSPIGGVLARLACRKVRKSGTKVIYTAHGFHFYKGAPFMNWLLFYPIEKLCARYTDVLITINQEDYALAKKKIRAKAVQYVPGVGIDSERSSVSKKDAARQRQLLREQVHCGDQDILVLSVGELSHRKNHQVILRAMGECPDKTMHYAICGQGANEQKLYQLAEELGIQNRVHLLGFQTNIQEWLTAADIFAFPSLQEGLPVALMEAMAMGLPIVCSRIRGNVDLITEGKGGYLGAPGDVVFFKEALERLAEDEDLRHKLGAYNRQAVKAFDYREVQNVMKTVYEVGE